GQWWGDSLYLVPQLRNIAGRPDVVGHRSDQRNAHGYRHSQLHSDGYGWRLTYGIAAIVTHDQSVDTCDHDELALAGGYSRRSVFANINSDGRNAALHLVAQLRRVVGSVRSDFVRGRSDQRNAHGRGDSQFHSSGDGQRLTDGNQAVVPHDQSAGVCAFDYD